MSRLIDADELKKAFDFDDDVELEVAVVHYGINHAPTVDAVPVVRCKDCRFNPKVSFVGCPMSGLDKRKDWDFCSYGDEVTE